MAKIWISIQTKYILVLEYIFKISYNFYQIDVCEAKLSGRILCDTKYSRKDLEMKSQNRSLYNSRVALLSKRNYEYPKSLQRSINKLKIRRHCKSTTVLWNILKKYSSRIVLLICYLQEISVRAELLKLHSAPQVFIRGET